MHVTQLQRNVRGTQLLTCHSCNSLQANAHGSGVGAVGRRKTQTWLEGLQRTAALHGSERQRHLESQVVGDVQMTQQRLGVVGMQAALVSFVLAVLACSELRHVLLTTVVHGVYSFMTRPG